MKYWIKRQMARLVPYRLARIQEYREVIKGRPLYYRNETSRVIELTLDEHGGPRVYYFAPGDTLKLDINGECKGFLSGVEARGLAQRAREYSIIFMANQCSEAGFTPIDEDGV